AGTQALLAERGIARRIDGTGQVPQDRGLEAELARILRGPEHAVVAREAADEHVLDAALAEVAREPRRGALALRVPVVTEGAVRVDGRVGRLADDRRDRFPRKPGRERRTGCALDAVVGPQNLFAAVELD